MANARRFGASVRSEEGSILKLAKLGLEYAELVPSTPLQGRIQAVSRALSSAGVTAVSFHGHNSKCDIGDSDSVGKSEAVRQHKEHLQDCASLGAKYYVIHPGFESYLNRIGGSWNDARKVIVFQREESSMTKLWEANAGPVAELADFAAGLNVKIAFETGPTNLITIAETLRIVKATGRTNVGVCLDTGHVNVGGVVKPQDAIREVGQLLWTLHLHDNMGDGDFHLPPGKGSIDWVSVAEALRDVSYGAVLNLELGAYGKNEEEWLNEVKEGVLFLSGIFSRNLGVEL